MHVAIVCRGLGGAGSVAAVALRQARELAKSERVTLISDSFPDDCAFERILVAPPDFALLRRLRHVFDEVAFARVAKNALLAIPDVGFVLAHSHATAYIAARHRGVPFGLFVHGDIFDRPAGTYDARLTAFYQWVTPRAYRAANVTFVLSQPFVELATRHGAKDVVIVPNGIDPAEIGARETGARHTPLRILNVGRLAVEKGLDDLIDACDLLDFDYRLTFVGSGPLAEHLLARGNAKMQFIGVQPRSNLGALYADHDVFCAPSISEAFGLVVLEALACGLPVVGTRVGGIGEMVQDEANGLLVPPHDPRALADALTRLANDEPLRARLAANARASVLPRFSWAEIGARILGVIRRMPA
ncbi:MAG TPA: glycosyltransferase family 4 protein [Thermoanaerobaculia bacterium]